MIATNTFAQFDDALMHDVTASFSAPLPAPGFDRYDDGIRTVDAIATDLTLDAGILEGEDLFN